MSGVVNGGRMVSKGIICEPQIWIARTGRIHLYTTSISVVTAATILADIHVTFGTYMALTAGLTRPA
jgi:hypothetical protein